METDVLAHGLEGKTALLAGAPAACQRIGSALAERGVRTVFGVLSADESEFGLAERFDSAEREHGSIGIVILFLEAVAESSRMTDLSLEAYDSITRRLARAPFFLLQQAARRLAVGGKVILVQQQATAGAASQGAADAVQVYARVLTRELGARGITVNTVSAGDLTTHDEAARAADLLRFLVGNDSRWINGQRLQTSGACQPNPARDDSRTPGRALEARVALVTGASRGIGAQIARRLARSGAIVIVDYPDETEQRAAMKVVEEIVDAGGVALAMQADAGDPQAIRALFAGIVTTHGGLDIVVFNAGGDAVVKSIADTSETDYDRVMRLNARGQFVAIQTAARLLRDNGRIVFVSSSTATQPYPGTASYAGAKIASEAYIRAIASEVAERGITANVVSPGMTATETMLSQTTEARRSTVIAATPLGRIAAPADIADVVHFIATPHARGINGQIVHVNGGLL